MGNSRGLVIKRFIIEDISYFNLKLLFEYNKDDLINIRKDLFIYNIYIFIDRARDIA
jgi:hypothetical protein